MLTRLIVVAIGYCFGLFQTGYLLSKYVLHEDIRTKGSGNSGATNALRVFGVKAGLITFLGDVLKALIYCLILKLGFGAQFGDQAEVIMLYGGLGVILGHSYPFYMNFKGGKGVASSAGVLFAYDWRLTVILLLIFVVIVYLTRYVSLGSLIAVGLLPVAALIFHALSWHVIPAAAFAETIILMLVLVALCTLAHRANIGRLKNGNENKISFKKKGTEK